MPLPRLGVITFGDDRKYEWEHVFKAMTVPRHERLISEVSSWPVHLIASEEVARSLSQIDAQVDDLLAAGAEVLVAHTPCWTPPNQVVRGVLRAALPTALLSNRDPSTHGLVGLLGAAGALDQIGRPHLRIRTELDDGVAREQLLPFVRAAAAVRGLHGSVFGLFGGRSLGIDTGTIDAMQWRRLFGIDVEHVDQLEIIRRAESMPKERITEAVTWLTHHAGRVAYDDVRLTPERLAYQVSCYLATLDIIDDRALDFAAIKCMPELSTDYVPQCVSACLLPMGGIGAEPRDSFMLACEADGDGALTMHLLKYLSGGTPAFFADVSHVMEPEGLLCLPNCGAFCGWYARRAADAAANMAAVELRPANRKGGGAMTFFQATPGPVTLARLSRRAGEYRLLIAPGEMVQLSPEEQDAFDRARSSHPLPAAFVRLSGSTEALIQSIGANHISGVAGDVRREMLHFARLTDIPVDLIDEDPRRRREEGL